MKLVMTLLAHDEADVVDAQVAFHLNAGVDLVIATDHRSSDETTEILERYAREGHVLLIREQREEFLESEFITRMARLAAREHGADWVINSAADEFWWPQGGDLKSVLALIPSRYSVVQAVIRNFVPRPDDRGFFSERMTVRLTMQAPINDPASPWRSYSKMIHRGDASVTVGRGGHHVAFEGSVVPLRGWYPVEVLHFGVRSVAQCAKKAASMQRAFSSRGSGPGTGYHASAYRALAEGRVDDYYAALALDDDDVARGIADGTLTVDTRLRDVVRALRDPSGAFVVSQGTPTVRFPTPTIVEDAAYAVEVTVLGEADLVRLRRDLDDLEGRLGRLERRPSARLRRFVVRAARRLSGRRS
jgi:hypothetical protein